jgi:hypothetical protein
MIRRDLQTFEAGLLCASHLEAEHLEALIARYEVVSCV